MFVQEIILPSGPRNPLLTLTEYIRDVSPSQKILRRDRDRMTGGLNKTDKQGIQRTGKLGFPAERQDGSLSLLGLRGEIVVKAS